jgi:acetylglutamate kinase
MEKLYIVKIGGNVIDNETDLHAFLESFAAIKGNKILIHGGGKIATRIAEGLGIEQTMVNGRRITDKQTLDIVVMTYAGLINKNIVAKLQSFSSNAIGLCGADANIILSHKRAVGEYDYGYVGDVDAVDTAMLQGLLALNLTPILSPITHDKNGVLLNTNADTIAQEIATACAAVYDVSLIYSFEKNGVLADINDERSVIQNINASSFTQLKNDGVISDGMLPKLENALKAIDLGVSKVIIGKADQLHELIQGQKGTTIGK